MGATNPPAATGVPATQPTPTATTFKLDFRFQVNELPSALPRDLTPLPAPLYAGLAGGFPGLYQINFVVPEIPAGLPACALGEGPELDLVNTNLTVNVGEGASFDGALICVSVRK
jgi:uncharacterized protein (TIGR03437 family)